MDRNEITKEGPEGEAPRRRLQLDFSREAYRRLEEIRVKSDSRSNAELVRNALRLYEWILEQKQKNFKIQLVKDNIVKEVEILF